MSFIPMSGGGALSETVLWTNGSSTSNFSAQTVTLSDDIDNYSYLKFEYRVHTGKSDLLSCIYSVEDIKVTSSASYSRFGAMANMNAENSSRYSREFYYSSDTKIVFTDSRGSVNGNQNNAYTIPTRIIGLK